MFSNRPEIRIPLVKPNLSYEEANAVRDVVLSTWLNEGNLVREFEAGIADYTGVKYAVAFFNGTAALHAILLSLSIKSGDEVIVPSFTFFSTVSTVVHVGAIPVFADIDSKTFNISPKDIEKKLTSKTRAIIPVHYGGLAADMDAILTIADTRNLFVIEDAAEAIGSQYKGKKVGSLGKAGMFSFTPTKNITTGEGGVATTNDSELARMLRLYKDHGQEGTYYHVLFGYNYRMTEMQAAIGIEQLKKLERLLMKKREVVRKIDINLQGIENLFLPSEPSDMYHTYMLYTVCFKDYNMRELVRIALAEKGIETKIYFPPVHKQPVFKNSKVSLPVTEEISSRCLSLPCYASMTDEEITYLTDSIRNLLK